jgi:hypothetical protein
MKEVEYRKQLVERILEQPASICHDWYQGFTKRGKDKTVIEWNEPMLKDVGVPVFRLRDIAVVLENRAELMGLIPKVN